jgi:hypothetical protein
MKSNATKVLEDFALVAQSKLHLRRPLGTTSLLLADEHPELFEVMLSNTGGEVIEVHSRKNSHQTRGTCNLPPYVNGGS